MRLEKHSQPVLASAWNRRVGGHRPQVADGFSTVGVWSAQAAGTSDQLSADPNVSRSMAGLAIQAAVPLPLHVLALALGWFLRCLLYLGAAVLIPAAHAQASSRWLPVATMGGVALVTS